jgi:hypothetical protein
MANGVSRRPWFLCSGMGESKQNMCHVGVKGV